MDRTRVWLYSRVAHPDFTALECQKNLLAKYASSQDFEIAGTTAEQCSGLDYHRDGLCEVLRAAEDGEIDLVLVADISRLGRDVAKTNNCVRWLQQRDVKVVCVDGTVIEPLAYSFVDLIKASKQSHTIS